jgi:parallel beta-helix repeat protein
MKGSLTSGLGLAIETIEPVHDGADRTAGPVATGGYTSVDEAVLALAEHHDVTMGPSEMAAWGQLRDLPAAVRNPLADLIGAFLALDTSSRADMGEPALSPWESALPPDAPRKTPERSGLVLPGSTDSEPASIPSFHRTRVKFLDATEELVAAFHATPPKAYTKVGPAASVNLCPALALDLQGHDNHYEQDCALVLDIGGKDTYHNNAGGSNLAGGACHLVPVGPGEWTAAAVVDLGQGDDVYGDPLNPRRCGANGGGAFGLGHLIDAGGTDTYVAGGYGTNGGGRRGAGLLIDASGSDTYQAGHEGTNGGSYIGHGLLIDLGGDDTYEARHFGTNGGSEAGTGALLDAGGRDYYEDPELLGGSCWDCTRIPKEMPDPGIQWDSDHVPRRPAAQTCRQHDPHPPIRITEDHGPQGFNWTNPATGADEHRSGSGVVAGNGTASNPYVVAGWCIADPPSERVDDPFPGILLEDTEAHVVVRHTVVVGVGQTDSHGIRVDGAANVTLRNNTLLHNTMGVYARDAGNMRLSGNNASWNELDGFHLRDSDEVEVIDNRVALNGRDGIGLIRSHDATIRNNSANRNNRGGIGLDTSNRSQIMTKVLNATFQSEYARPMAVTKPAYPLEPTGRAGITEEDGRSTASHALLDLSGHGQ